ncbi:MAG TPA: ATP-dependent RNA helicase HrpA [Dokdonella sp.]|uniref:ATP-dependent RNA helicase HrpA n=1 Tax=Dokdonella sp. TaxID=2291710 RepID=UPI002D7FC3A7|nr:ATP-dependent RNA helicase HrpA [Dokdonella sp.]HET9033905.1 ATP-dependent RNA helicase HrpA [Dokdonella sp.]
MSDLSKLKPALAGVSTRDRGRLIGRLRRLEKDGASVKAEQVAKLAAEIEASTARVAMRAARMPPIRIDESLPIAERSEEIVKLIREHQVIILAGETGSGKTTQLPKLCLAAGRGTAGMIGCTQPRRIAARTVARRVADELGTTVGDLVGFQVRFNDQVGEASLIKFMTDGILLAETQGDAWLSSYDTIILDEAHERSLNIDFLLGYLKRLLKKRRDLKLIVTSATIDTARFAEHFGNAPVVEVEGRTYPVEVRWRPPPERGETSSVEQIVSAIDEISAEDPRGDVLIFLPGEREIRDAHLALDRRKYRETEVLALYARLSANEQDRVFKPGPKRRIVLATNVAETSLTVPRIRFVVDTGNARVKRYSQRGQLERLHIEPISQAAADQRKGRCGRVAAGICYRLYAEDDYAERPRYTDPEILRTSLAGVILRMLSLKLGDVADFPFVEAPPERAIGDGYRRLIEIGAIDEQHRITKIGTTIASLPVDVALARMLIEAQRLNVSLELMILVSFLSIQDPRERPADARPQADAAHAQFTDPKSDFIGVLNLWAAYAQAHADFTQSKLRDWCRAHFLSFMRMREWRELHRQLVVGRGVGETRAGVGSREWGVGGAKAGVGSRESGVGEQVSGKRVAVSGKGKRKRGRDGRPSGSVEAKVAVPISHSLLPTAASVPPNPDNGEAIHRCLLSGWPTQVARKDERNQFRGTRERKFAIFPGSALAKSPPQWVLAGQIIDIGKVYAMQCARVEPLWIEQQAAHLIRRSWNDAHWSRKRGAVVAYEQVSLFGLILVERRAVQFGKQDPAQAHEIFVREALATGEIDARADFIRANQRTLAQAEEIEAKQRRSGLLKSAEERVALLHGKLPADIHTSATLDAWYRKASPAEQAALRWSLADVMSATPGLAAEDFPTRLAVGNQHIRLDYRFVPGDPADGVTAHVPLALVNALSASACEWLVPGLLIEKVSELIRGLPKSLRRNFVPAPDFARAFVESLGDDKPIRERALAEVLSAYLKKVTGVAIDSADFSSIDLPAHLQMRFRVTDEKGKVVAEGRDLAAIQRDWSDAAREAFSQRADAELTREEVADFDIEDIPEVIRSAEGLVAFPALVDLGDSVALRVFENADDAREEHRRGVERLLRRALADKIKHARKQLPLGKLTELKWASLGSAETLRADLVEAALSECLQQHTLDARTRVDFEALKAELGKALFPAAVERLTLAEAIIEAHAELVPWLEPPLLGFASANYEDLLEQRDELLAPGFLRETDPRQLEHIPRYLRGMRLRGERLRQDPARDQARMLNVHTYWREYLKRRSSGDADPAALDELRWLIEELRVSVFAQELRTAEPVSPKRLARAVAALG